MKTELLLVCDGKDCDIEFAIDLPFVPFVGMTINLGESFGWDDLEVESVSWRHSSSVFVCKVRLVVDGKPMTMDDELIELAVRSGWARV